MPGKLGMKHKPKPADPDFFNVQCPECMEHVTLNNEVRLDRTDRGWKKHKHQPKGCMVLGDALKRKSSSLTYEDFRNC